MLRFIILFFLTSITVAASGQSILENNASLFVENATIENAIVKLSQVNQINISFKSNIFPKEKRVSIRVENKPIRSILKTLLADTYIGFKEVSGQIVLFKKEAPSKRKFTIRGYITEKETGEFIEGAHVFVQNTQLGTFSNQYGFYSITLQEGLKNLMVSYLGYKHVLFNMELKKDLRLDISLESSFSLDSITVTSSDSSRFLSHYRLGVHDFNIQNIQMQPSIGGEDDIFRAANHLTGIQSSADGIGGLHVRGGSIDQNLVLLDGVPIYNSSHALGIFSIYNTDAIKSAKILKGGFPARYGGRLSSVMDIRMKEGNKNKFTTAISQSLIASKVNIEGPIHKGKGSFFISGRRAITELYVPAISKFLNEKSGKIGSTSYHFSDINGKINYALTSKDKVFVSFYKGADHFARNAESKGAVEGINQFQQKDTLSYKVYRNYLVEWGNAMTAVRWNHEIMDNLFLNTTFTFSRYDFLSHDRIIFDGTYLHASDTITSTAQTNFNEELTTKMVKLDFDYTPSTKHYIRFGGNFAFHSFNPGIIRNTIIGVVDTQEVNRSTPLVKQREINGYFEDEIQLKNRFILNIGLRVLGWEINDKFKGFFQPRAVLSKEFNEKWDWNLTYSKMIQPLHLLSKRSIIAFPAEVWLPSTDQIGPQSARQISTGVNHILRNDMIVGAEIYYKEMADIVSFLPTDSVLILDANSWEEKIDVGTGKNYGIELSIHKNIGKFQGTVNYSYAYAKRHFPKVNKGISYPFQYDRRHQATILANYFLNDNWTFNMAFMIGSSTALTFPVKQYLVPGEGPVHIGEEAKNSFRVTPYQRLDIGFTYKKQLKYFHQIWQAGIYNVYSKYNVLYVEIHPELKNPAVSISGSPILPYLKYTMKF